VSDDVSFSPWQIEESCLSSAGVAEQQRDRGPRVTAAVPNPAVGPVQILYTTPEGSEGTGALISIYDCAGRLRRRLDGGTQPAGLHLVTWDGRDRGGRPVGPGAYFCRVRQTGREGTGRITILR
jgi:hypothetical protein